MVEFRLRSGDLVVTYPPTKHRRLLAPQPQLGPPFFLLHRFGAALAPGNTTDGEKRSTLSVRGTAGLQGPNSGQLTC